MYGMSLLRNSVIVGGATFLVGSAFMEISKADSKSDIGKWPYIATFLSGALGFYLLKQQFVPVPKALELNADTYISKKMRERHFGRDDREADLDAIREEWAEGKYDGLDIEMPDGSIHSIGTVWVEDKIPIIYHLGQMRYSFRNDELYQTYFPTQIPLPKNAEYDFQNQAITTVTADEEDEAWEKLPHVYDSIFEDWEIVDIRESENFSKDFTFNIDIDEAIIENRDELEDRGYSDEDIEDLEEEILNNVNKDDILDQIKSDELDSIGGGTMDFADEVYLKRRDRMVDDVEASIDYEVDAGDWNAESSSSLQSFAAEVFMADRKIRRRTRWTWTRGPEKGYDDKDTVPYSDIYDYTSRKGRGWRSDYVPKYLIEDSYHINDLPEGYHLHLLKPNLRKDNWVAFAKSPSSDEWKKYETTNKSEITEYLLQWYNEDIAKPEVAELSPIDKLMIQSGMASGDVQISRIETKGFKGDEYNKIQWFASGGPDRLPVIEIATALGSEGAGYPDGGISVRVDYGQALKYGVLPFAQGLLFMGHSAGTNRSVNRYNKDSAKWVKSYPAWFQNAVKNRIEGLWFDLDPQGNYQPKYRVCRQDVVIFDTESAEGKIETMGGKMRGFRVRVADPSSGSPDTYYRPRPSTQRKLYEASFKMGLDGRWNFNAADLFMAICDKFKFEDLDSIQTQMMSNSLKLNRTFRDEDETLQNVGKLMLRRFKKK